MMKQDFHVFQGMRQDNHQIRQESKYLWEAHNIRFTAREGNTLLSMTNEKGTELLSNNESTTMEGEYIGHCVLGKYLVVFTYVWSPVPFKRFNHIYRISNIDEELKVDLLVNKPLGIPSGSTIQTLGIYEGENVQKVYWVDNVNQPRVINIKADALMYGRDISELTDGEKDKLYPTGCFDFIQTLALEEEIEVKREDGGGSFSSGTIQYAFSYYNKFGQESNIFYTTALYNVSFVDRGGSPEDAISNSFHINIKNIETKFQFIRVYSIHRTSINATPLVKVVTDIEVLGRAEITYVDTGLTGYNIDPTRLLYVGGESIVAKTLTEKDNTLFLGNITVSRNSISEETKNKLKDYVNNGAVKVVPRVITLKDLNNIDSVYNYSNQLSVGNTSTYKVGDKYRLGVQFQYKTGKWSEPVWIGDYTIPTIDTVRPLSNDNLDSTNRPHRNGNNLIVPSLEVSIDTKDLYDMQEYKRARAIVVLPSIYDRMVLAQGILCPTVFSIKDRVSNTPFAQSSWFFRPMSKTIDNSSSIEKGATVAFKHLDPLLSLDNRGAEIQSMSPSTFEDANNKVKADKATSLNTFFVDQSIVTMHSPDIEFNDSTKQVLDNNEFDLNIVGLVSFKSNAGDISIQTSSAVPAPNDTGFIHRTFLTTNYENKGLVAGMFYSSHIIASNKDTTEFYAYEGKDSAREHSWLIYPWHRSGSLNNDLVRGSDKGTRTSVLKRKVISNLRYSTDTVWLKNVWHSNDGGINSNGITPISIFDSNEVSLIKIPTPKNSGIKSLNYYGNVDTLVTTDTKYNFYIAPYDASNPFTYYPLKSITEAIPLGLYEGQLKYTKEPVRMKYKSTPHAVFAFNYLNNHSPVILPSIRDSINVFTDKSITPFWASTEGITIVGEPTQLDIVNDGGTDSIQENIDWLNTNANHEGYTGPTLYAVCTSSFSSDYGYLYSWNSAASSWQRVPTLGDYADMSFKEANDNYYWIVIAEPNWILKKVEYKKDAVYSTKQANISATDGYNASLFLAELKRKSEPANMFGGNTEEALRSNSWIPAGPPVKIGEPIKFEYGDTYYQRYDCLKTYAFTNEDENSIVEIASFMCESRVNLDGRYDRNRGQLSNLNMSPINFNLMNPVYSQKDNFFNYRILDKEYYKNNNYPTQVAWSLEKSYLSEIDTWTNVTLANSIDLSGSAGSITSLETFNDLLIAFQEKSISQILFNSRVQIPASDGTPIEISNNYKVDGTRPISDIIGCQDKAAISKSPNGIYFIDNNTDTLYLFNGQINDISNTLGVKFWMKKYHSNNTWSIIGSSGVRLSYDTNNNDLYLSPIGDKDNENALCYSEQLKQFTSLMSYSKAAMFSMDNMFYSINVTGNSRDKVTNLWRNFTGDYNMFYGELKLPSFTYISNEDPTYTKIFDTIEYRADVYNKDGNLASNRSFDWIEAANEYQNTGKKNLSQSRRTINDISLRKKFRVWRSQIPREGRARIRNPWASISLGFNESSDVDYNKFHFILHDISTKYTI